MRRVSIDPSRYISRNITKLKHRWYRAYTWLTTKDGSIYLIDNKLYQVWGGKYTYIGEVDELVHDGDYKQIPESAIIKP